MAASSPKPVNLTLSASGVGGQPVGGLTVGEGAILQMVDQSSLSLKAANHLLMLGDATSACAGKIRSGDQQPELPPRH